MMTFMTTSTNANGKIVAEHAEVCNPSCCCPTKLQTPTHRMLRMTSYCWHAASGLTVLLGAGAIALIEYSGMPPHQKTGATIGAGILILSSYYVHRIAVQYGTAAKLSKSFDEPFKLNTRQSTMTIEPMYVGRS